VVLVQEDQYRSDYLPDPPRVQADVAQRLEGHLQQRVAPLADGPQAVVDLIELLDRG
jgi:hypothetical protein